MAGTLDIQLLGSPLVTVDGSPIKVDTRKAIAMLAHLVIEGSADRNTLTGLFWADSSPDRARATLRRTLSALRGGIGSGAIVADRNMVSLTDGFRCDVAEFRTAVAATGSHGHDRNDVCASCVAPLTKASALYRGDFLGSFSVADAPEFEDWARSVTETLRLEAGSVFRRLAMAQASAGDYPAAIAAANRWVDLDDLHEPAHRLVMLLNAWSGDRPGSIQAYRDCVAVLDRELSVSPLEETTELYEAILDEDLPPAPGMPRAVRTHVYRQPAGAAPMINRRHAVATLQSAIEASQPSSRLCLLTGDAWMGKTRLLDHTAAYAAERGHLVVRGMAFRAETALPYGVSTQILESLIPTLEGPESLPAWALLELTRLAPRLAPGQDPPDLGRLGQLRLREAFLELLEAVRSTESVVIVVDDAQWADAASAGLLAYLRRRAHTIPLKIVLATRSPEALHPALREVAADAEDTIVLQPLGASDLSADYAHTDLAAVIAATGGIPLLVQEAIASGGVGPEVSTVVKYLESRRQRLSDLAGQVMATAAVLNGMCDAPLLKDTSGRTEEEVVDAVEELVSAGLLRELDDGHIGFTLDAVEAMTYESTSTIRRRLLHRRAADALSARPRATGDPRLVAAIADHHRAAGSDEAAGWYRLAGDLARAVFANDEAVIAYEHALALGYTPVGEVRLALGELAIARADYEVATRELRTAASHSTDATLALVEHRIGELHRIMGRFELADESFTRAEVEHPKVSVLYADWALLKHRLGEPVSARALATKAEEAARVTGDITELARSLNVLGLVTTDPIEATRHIDAALAATDPDHPARIAALNNKAHILSENDQVDAAVELVTEAIAIAERSGYRHQHAALLNHMADLYHQSGREGDSQQALIEAVTLFAEIDHGDWEPEVWLLRQW